MPSRLLRLSLLVAALLAPASACHRAAPALASPAGLATLDAGASAPAPDSFVVRLETSRGPFLLMVHRDWAPRGADRIHALVQLGYYDGARFFRAVPNFVVQFGLAANPAATAAVRGQRIADDSVRRSNVRGTLSFAAAGPNSRTTQLFINLRDNQRLDHLGFAVVAQVVAGMDVVDSLYTGYGEGAPRGQGPTQDRIAQEGEAYLARDFPRLDQVRRATIVRRFGGGR